MPGKAHRDSRTRRTTLVCVVVCLGALALVSFAFPPAGHESADSLGGFRDTAATPIAVKSPAAWSESAESKQLELQLEAICPQAVHAWRQEIDASHTAANPEAGPHRPTETPVFEQLAAREPRRQLMATKAVGGVRVATRPDRRSTQASSDWLVSPENWFVPEDEQPGESTTGAAPDNSHAPATVEEPPQATGEVAPTIERVPPDAARPAPVPTLTGANDRDKRASEPLFAPPVGTTSAEPVYTEPIDNGPQNVVGSPFAHPPIGAAPNGAVQADLGFDPVGDRLPSPHGASPTTSDAAKRAGEEAHRELLAKNCYPSAQECATCHQKIYDEWAVSSHAYAFVSPMFQKFEQKIREVSQGTVGHFCYRCHAPVSTAMGVGQDEPLWNLSQVEREGVTCIACHRVKYRYTKSNGDRRIEPGDIYDPVYGGIGGDGVAKAIADASTYKIKTSPDEKGPGQAIHREGRYFDQLGKSEFCTSCHQVAVHPGIKLEVVWEQHRQSPARKKGISCQDCHMGKVPGIASGYEVGAIAEVNEKTVCDTRKHGNHTFYGPGYSIAHPGIFPFHKDASRWTMDEWLLFDWRAGWGTDDFEDADDDGKIVVQFPKVWAEADDRYDAREIVADNQKRLARKTELRRQVMENGSHVDGPFFKSPPQRGRDLVLHYNVSNTNEGHNLPTASLGAQPQLWANVVLIDPDGQRVWETGYTDHWGDLCDIHSQDVRRGIAPFDSQLFNLQTMFLITGATGTDREFYLPVNVDFDQLPFLRPGAIPTSVTNHPPFIRMESRSIAPLGVKRVKYKIPAEAICKPGTYRLSFRMRSRTEPIYFMRFCESTIEMQRSMNEGILDIHPYSVEFVVE